VVSILHEPNSPAERGTSRDELIPSIHTLLGDLVLQGRTRLKAIARDYGLTYYQATVLLMIRRNGPSTSMSTLIEALQLPASTVTSVIDALVARNLVIRGTRANDRRAVTASVTSEGSELVESLAQRRYEIFAASFTDLTDADLQAVHSLLNNIVNATPEKQRVPG
jgi:DNA-binding MarR family transcriptional regulator